MGVILFLWILGLIVIAIAWGVMDKIALPMKARAQSWLSMERSKGLELAVAGLLALAMITVMLEPGNQQLRLKTDLPTLLIWAGGLWLIPFQFDASEYYWLVYLAIGTIVTLLLVWGTSSSSTRTPVCRPRAPQEGQDPSTDMNSLGFLLWTSLIGFSATAIASTWNGAILHS